jgi:hypothetical protein
MSSPLSSPFRREKYREDYFIEKSAMSPLEARRRTVPDLNKIGNGVFFKDKL